MIEGMAVRTALSPVPPLLPAPDGPHTPPWASSAARAGLGRARKPACGHTPAAEDRAALQ